MKNKSKNIESKNTAAERSLRLTINLYKRLSIPVNTLNKNFLSKQIVPTTYTLKKMFFVVAFFKGL